MENTVLFWLVQSLIVLFGIAVGHSILLFKLRREENRRRELEITLIEKKTEMIKQGKLIVKDIEDAFYKVKVQQEIDDIISKGNS